MTNRLQELLRQKALLEEHTAWLEREIAAEMARGPAPASPAIPTASAATAPTTANADAEGILGQYRSPAHSIHQQVLRGCVVYLAVALALLALSVLGIYYFYHRR